MNRRETIPCNPPSLSPFYSCTPPLPCTPLHPSPALLHLALPCTPPFPAHHPSLHLTLCLPAPHPACPCRTHPPTPAEGTTHTRPAPETRRGAVPWQAPRPRVLRRKTRLAPPPAPASSLASHWQRGREAEAQRNGDRPESYREETGQQNRGQERGESRARESGTETDLWTGERLGSGGQLIGPHIVPHNH